MQSKKLVLSFIAAITLFVGGCNLFNPTESINVDSDDAEALTYEGYIQFQKNDYNEAEKYFRKAIKADKTHSEAWYGLAKTIMSQQGINPFEFLKYANVSSGVAIPFYDMDDKTAQKYESSLDTVRNFLQTFIELDTTGNLDNVITFGTFANSYMVLESVHSMLGLRSAAQDLDVCDKNNPNVDKECDLGVVLNSLKGKVNSTLDGFHEVFNTCKYYPSAMRTAGDQFLQGFDLIKDEAKDQAFATACGALAQTTESGEDNRTREKSLNIVIAQFGYSDTSDDDGDGCVDEELYDGVDNDGDGEIDEDIRDRTNPIVYDIELAYKNKMAGKNNIKDLMIVKSAKPNDKYEKVDVDMNGIPGKKDDDEWSFVYPDYNKRVEKNDHRFAFAKKLTYNPKGLSNEDFTDLKYNVAKDTDPHNIQYDLKFRQENIGGCWVNYDQQKFEQWFQGRN